VSDLPGRLVLLGHPVKHSLSPAFQNAALVAAKIPLTYEAIDVAPHELPSLLSQLVANDAAGNVTIPHKSAVANACGRLSVEAQRTGAVNAFRVEDQVLVGHNTDVSGFDQAARDLLGTTPKDLTVGVFGAGGAAAAVLAAVESWDHCRALIANRDMGRAETLAERFRSVTRAIDGMSIAEHADIVVNATALGMAADQPGPIDPANLRRARWVLDLVYTPTETAFVRAARARGIRARDGLPMLLAQGAAAFAWWFGRPPNLEVMWRAVGRSPREND
jgi:shikimate dehydrogenase